MTDRELLELAAKAIGLELRGKANDIYYNVHDADDQHDLWNPLTDNGDCFLLAVELGLILNLSPRKDCRGQTVVTYDGFCQIEEPCYEGREEAARRAVVRAAAEIGKAMP